MDQADGTGSEAGVELLLVEVLHVVGRQVLELPVAQGGLTPLQGALAASVSVIDDAVTRLCKQTTSVHFDKPAPDPSAVKVTWHFENLLGAMYLQMWWVVTSSGELSRCEYCGRLISLTRPDPRARKRRRDKRFCDDACRQAHHRAKKGS